MHLRRVDWGLKLYIEHRFININVEIYINI